jgi:hypothetical protein
MKKEKKIQNVPFKPTFCFDFVTAVKINLVPSFLTFIVAPQIERKEGRIQSTATNSINCHSPPIWEEEEEEAEPTIQTCAYGRF